MAERLLERNTFTISDGVDKLHPFRMFWNKVHCSVGCSLHQCAEDSLFGKHVPGGRHNSSFVPGLYDELKESPFFDKTWRSLFIQRTKDESFIWMNIPIAKKLSEIEFVGGEHKRAREDDEESAKRAKPTVGVMKYVSRVLDYIKDSQYVEFIETAILNEPKNLDLDIETGNLATLFRLFGVMNANDQAFKMAGMMDRNDPELDSALSNNLVVKFFERYDLLDVKLMRDGTIVVEKPLLDPLIYLTVLKMVIRAAQYALKMMATDMSTNPTRLTLVSNKRKTKWIVCCIDNVDLSHALQTLTIDSMSITNAKKLLYRLPSGENITLADIKKRLEVKKIFGPLISDVKELLYRPLPDCNIMYDLSEIDKESIVIFIASKTSSSLPAAHFNPGYSAQNIIMQLMLATIAVEVLSNPGFFQEGTSSVQLKSLDKLLEDAKPLLKHGEKTPKTVVSKNVTFADLLPLSRTLVITEAPTLLAEPGSRMMTSSST